MELYFKDLEGDGDTTEMSLDHLGGECAGSNDESAEAIAFAELAERVSAARLVY